MNATDIHPSELLSAAADPAPAGGRGSARGKATEKRARLAFTNSPRGRFGAYRASAAALSREFRLTFEQFMAFWQQPCSYCGGAVATVGLDRVDNTRGYLPGNVTPCCSLCNWMKREHSATKFLAHCRKIAAFSGQPL